MGISLAEPTAPRCRVAALRRWGLGSRVRGDNELRRLHTISATSGPRSSQPCLVLLGVGVSSRLSCKISLSTCYCFAEAFDYDENCRQRGKDERDSPWLGHGDE